MNWIEKVLDHLDHSLEWRSLGKISWRFNEENNQLRLAPALMEVVGGTDDGENVYPSYLLDVLSFIEVFDKPPSVTWDTHESELSFDGLIGGNDTWITFSQQPFDDDEPQDVIDTKGDIRQK